MLYKFFITILCTHMLFAGAHHPETLNFVGVDDVKLIRTGIQLAVTKYNKEATKKADLKLFEDGDELILEKLTGVNAVFCDIQMDRENGNVALARLSKKADQVGFILPPFIATTSFDEYYEGNNGPSEKATVEGFIGGRDKIKSAQDIYWAIKLCEDRLGIDWLKTRVGRYINILERYSYYFENSALSVLLGN